jgi:hypothetical protein
MPTSATMATLHGGPHDQIKSRNAALNGELLPSVSLIAMRNLGPAK